MMAPTATPQTFPLICSNHLPLEADRLTAYDRYPLLPSIITNFFPGRSTSVRYGNDSFSLLCSSFPLLRSLSFGSLPFRRRRRGCQELTKESSTTATITRFKFPYFSFGLTFFKPENPKLCFFRPLFLLTYELSYFIVVLPLSLLLFL